MNYCTSCNKSNINGTVESKVRSIIMGMGDDIEYMFHNWAQANVEIDRVRRPTVLYVLPSNGSLNFTWNQVKDSPESFIAFIDSTELDFDGKENDNIIERMKILAIKFIVALNKSGLFEKIEGSVPYDVLYDHLDQNVTGIVIHPVLQETDGVLVCDDIISRN